MKAALAKACTTLKSDSEHCLITFSFKPDFIGFAGHFPDNPILPAIVQIMLAEHAISQTGSEFILSKIKSAKFLLPVVPDTLCQLEVNKQKHTWECSIDTEKGRVSRFTLEAADG